MEEAALSVQLRDSSSKAKQLRREGLLPAEFYGKGEDNISIQMDYQTFRKLYRVTGDNTIINLSVEGGPKKKVLVHRVDYHPVSDDFMYVEFINVKMDEEVTTNVPIVIEGTAPAVKDLGGVLTQSLDELEIRCLPGDLIHEVIVSAESLVDFHSALHVSDISLPAKIEVLTDPERTIATVSAPRAAVEEEEDTAEVDVASVEVPGEKPAEESSDEA